MVTHGSTFISKLALALNCLILHLVATSFCQVERSLLNTMEFEHLHEKDAKTEFTAPNGVTTTAATEWALVCAPEEGKEYPERSGYTEHHPAWCRVPKPLEEMLRLMEQVLSPH